MRVDTEVSALLAATGSSFRLVSRGARGVGWGGGPGLSPLRIVDTARREGALGQGPLLDRTLWMRSVTEHRVLLQQRYGWTGLPVDRNLDAKEPHTLPRTTDER